MTTTTSKDTLWREMQQAAKRFAEPGDMSDDAAMEAYLATDAGCAAYARYEAAPAHAAAHRQLSEPDWRGRAAESAFDHVNVAPKARRLVERGIVKTYDEAVERVFAEDPDLYTGYEAAVKRDRQQRTR